jgi:D-beta-D-heptose 7-phosphate kinase / D-beta-D-heptose 1-phosphate adenosyltransferase
MSAAGPRAPGLVVVGDTLLDIDLEGRAGRLAPDAPVPVLDDLAEHPRPGGAGLAALMAAADGYEVVLVTALGTDDAGRRVEELLSGVRVVRLPYDGPTPVKTRVRAGGQSLLRLDSGSTPGSFGQLGDDLVEQLRELLAGAAAVLVADYGRGVTGVPAVRDLLGALPHRVPVVWDPHPRGAAPVPGVRVVTPNAAEAEVLAATLPKGLGPDGATAPDRTGGLALAGRRAAALVAHWEAAAVVVTLGERGALLSYGGAAGGSGSAEAPVVTPAPAVHCIDPCGAGDRFAVTVAASLGAGRVMTEAVQDAVDAAAAYVAAGGPASLRGGRRLPGQRRSRDDLAVQVGAGGGTVVATGGCFDLLHAGHVATLRGARRLGDCLVVCLNSDASVRRLKGPSRPLVPAADRAKVLEALECVDAVVVFDEDTPVEAIRRLRPDVWAKGGDYAGADVPEAAVLREWGGQAVVLPYLEGRSTTALVRSAADRIPDNPHPDLESESR